MAKSFADAMKPGPTENVLVVDSLNLGFRWKHRGILDFADEYLRTVKSFAKSYNCGSIIITADWGSSTYRKNIFPEYKQNRSDLRKKQTEKEGKDFLLFIEEYNRTLGELEMEGYPVLKYKGVEADDIAAFIVKTRNTFKFDQVWMISTDRDWDLLIDDDVSRFSYINRKETTLDTWGDTYGVLPDEYLTYKCLVGDKGDNIPGISGIGDKRACQVIEQYGTVFDIYDETPIQGNYKYIKELNENAKQLLTNVELMDLETYCEEAIGPDNVKDIMNKMKEYLNL